LLFEDSVKRVLHVDLFLALIDEQGDKNYFPKNLQEASRWRGAFHHGAAMN